MKKIFFLITVLLFTNAASAERKVSCTFKAKTGSNPSGSKTIPFGYKDCEKNGSNKAKKETLDIFKISMQCKNKEAIINISYGEVNLPQITWDIPETFESKIFEEVKSGNKSLNYSCSVVRK